MKSTITTELAMVGGMMAIKFKEYPDWYGIEGIGFIWHNTQADPDLEFEGMVINSHIVEDTMWERYREKCDENGIVPDEDEGFTLFMTENAEEVKELCRLAGGER